MLMLPTLAVVSSADIITKKCNKSLLSPLIDRTPKDSSRIAVLHQHSAMLQPKITRPFFRVKLLIQTYTKLLYSSVELLSG